MEIACYKLSTERPFQGVVLKEKLEVSAILLSVDPQSFRSIDNVSVC
jgi:hypothetical protein